MKHRIIFLIGFIMFFLGSYYSYKYDLLVIIATLGAIIMGCSFMFKKDK